MERSDALKIMHDYVKNQGLRRHMYAVEAAMRYYARMYGEDQALWGLCGLLHDFDWEIHPNLENHPQSGALILREHGVSEEVIQHILSHADHTGVARDTVLRKALAACDEITGLITATALVRPSKSIMDVKVKSVKKKWKNKQFAAGTNREEMDAAFEDFGVEKWEHVGNVIEAMKEVADDLGLAGQPVPKS